MSFKSTSIIPEITNSIFSDRFQEIDKLFSKLTENKPVNIAPKYNILKKNNYIKLIISLQRWEKDELNINLSNKQLNIISLNKENKKKQKKI